jgi:hypothetical protein
MRVIFRSREIIDKTVFLPAVVNMESFLSELEKDVGKLAKEFDLITTEATNKIDNIEIIESDFNFNDWYLGECKYSSIGHTKYCYIAFVGDGTHIQWTKLYFRLGKIDMTKTTDYKKNRVDQLATSCVSDVPPAVMWVHEKYEGLATRMIEENVESIIEKAEVLPLNKEGMREDYSWNNTAIMVNNDDILRPCYDGDMANPNNDLMVVVFHSGSGHSKKTQGFAMSIDGGRPCRVLDHVSEFDKPPIDSGSVLKGFMSQTSRWKLSDNINKKDEYVQKLMNEVLDEWRNKQ